MTNTDFPEVSFPVLTSIASTPLEGVYKQLTSIDHSFYRAFPHSW